MLVSVFATHRVSSREQTSTKGAGEVLPCHPATRQTIPRVGKQYLPRDNFLGGFRDRLLGSLSVNATVFSKCCLPAFNFTSSFSLGTADATAGVTFPPFWSLQLQIGMGGWKDVPAARSGGLEAVLKGLHCVSAPSDSADPRIHPEIQGNVSGRVIPTVPPLAYALATTRGKEVIT